MKVTYLLPFIFLVGCKTIDVAIEPIDDTFISERKKFLKIKSIPKYEKLKADLTRKLKFDKSDFGQADAQAMFYTEPLIIMEQIKLGKEKSYSTRKIALNIKKKEKSLVDRRTCFLIKLSQPSLDRANFNNWQVNLKTHHNRKIHTLNFKNNKGIRSIASFKPHGKTLNSMNNFGTNKTSGLWTNESLACSFEKIPNLEEGFTLYLIPRFENLKVKNFKPWIFSKKNKN